MMIAYLGNRRRIHWSHSESQEGEQDGDLMHRGSTARWGQAQEESNWEQTNTEVTLELMKGLFIVLL